MTIFPEKRNYPDGFSILRNPDKDINEHIQLIGSSASAYFQTDPITRYFFKKRFRIVDEFLVGKKFKTGIDVGCGIGYSIPMLARHCNKIVGFDRSERALEYGKFMSEDMNIDNASFVKGDVRSLPFEDMSFDLVFCLSVIEHFKDLDGVLNELKRIVKPDGILIIGYPSETPFFHFAHQYLSYILPGRRRVKRILKDEDPDEDTFVGHHNDGKRISDAILKKGFFVNKRRAIKVIPPFLELYSIYFLSVSNETSF